MNKITLLGCPRPLGGACVESGHTALMWRRMGLKVTVISTSLEAEDNPWPERLAQAGCKVVLDNQGLNGLDGSLCVAFCCAGALRAWPSLKQRGCRMAWVPCMTIIPPGDRLIFSKCPPTGVVFQSEYQAHKLGPLYALWGTKTHSTIRGAFEIADFPFQPRKRAREFVIGKLSRAAPSKWPTDLWAIGEKVREGEPHARLLCMAWDQYLPIHLGEPPAWATCLPANTLTSQEFLSQCHVLLCAGEKDVENWPRVGLEAMASGVPVIADDSGGWPEMLGSRGLLATDTADATALVRTLAAIESWRLGVAAQGRKRVEKLVDPSDLTRKWGELFENLEKS